MAEVDRFTPVTVTNLSFPYVIEDFQRRRKTGNYISLRHIPKHRESDVSAGASSNLPLDNGAIAAVGDFNGDGKDDVAINLPGDTTISIWYSRGDGTFYEGAVLDPGQQAGAMAVGDFNDDGRADLAVGLMLGPTSLPVI